MGGPILFALLFVIILFLPVDPQSALGRGLPLLGLLVAAVFGCKLSYHLHMRSADNYGGAYTDPEFYRRAKIRYAVMCVVYAIIAVYLAHLAIEARGLELPF